MGMVETGILPACAQDMASYTAMPSLKGDRESVHGNIKKETDKLSQLFAKKPHDLAAEAPLPLPDVRADDLQPSLLRQPPQRTRRFSEPMVGPLAGVELQSGPLDAFLDQWSDRWLGWSSSQAPNLQV